MQSRVKERALPFSYQNNNDRLAILIHGFTGSPDDFQDLAKDLIKNNIDCRAILLAGHGSDWQDLKQTTHYHWWKSVEDQLLAASQRYQKIFLIGYSFGANLAFDLAARYPNKVTGVVSLGISVFLRMDFLARLLLPFGHFFSGCYRKGYIKKEHHQEYLNSGGYLIIPTKSIYEFYKFIDDYTKKELEKVNTPCLIIHSRDDSITNPFSSEYVYQRIGSQAKDLLILDDINHNPLVSLKKDIIFAKIKEFIQKQTEQLSDRIAF